MRRQWCAPGAVAIAGALPDWRIFARPGALAGDTRPPSPGKPLSPPVRIVIIAVPLFGGSVTPPANVAPGASAIVSPETALSIACCRFPPAGTVIVAAV